MEARMQEQWAIALEVANDAPRTGRVVVDAAVLLAVYGDMEHLRDVLEQCEHQTHSLRVWNGQQWTYHPPQAGRIAAMCKDALKPNV
jgi:hypothetical protein